MAGEFFASPASFRLNGAARWASPGSTLAALAKNSTGSLGHNNGIQVGQIRCAKWAMPDARTQKWVMRIAETVDKMDSDESGWCRHDPVSFITTDPAEAIQRLSDLLTPEKKRKK